MKFVSTIEARMSSTRLPGKVLLPANDKPMLLHLVDRLKQVTTIEEIVLATTTNIADNILENFVKEVGISCYRGSEEDVLQRVVEAGKSAEADVIVEITGDCPIIDPLIVEQALQMFKYNDCEYLGNAAIRSYPNGMDVQVFYLDTIERSASMTDDRLNHEHVTLYIRNKPELFRTIHMIAPPNLYWPDLHLTLDEQKDYELLKLIIEHFGSENPYFSCSEVIELLKSRPEWTAINKDIVRKGNL